MISKRRAGALLLVSLAALVCSMVLQLYAVNYFLQEIQKSYIEDALNINPDMDIAEVAKEAGSQLLEENVIRNAVLKSLSITWVPWFAAILIFRVCTLTEAALFVPACVAMAYPIFVSGALYFFVVAVGILINTKIRNLRKW